MIILLHMNSNNYIYLLQEREFIKSKEPIYKIGRSMQEHTKRFGQYPKGSQLLLQIICVDCKISEKILIDSFKKKYKHKKEIGNEYFEGDYKLMMDDIYTHVKVSLVDHSLKSDTACSVNDSDYKSVSSSNDSEPKSDSDSDSDSDSEIEEKDETITIDTYEEYIKYSKIKQFIITNKSKKEGYVRFPNNLWVKLYDKLSPTFDERNQETLEDFINKSNREDSIIRNNKTNTLHLFSEHREIEDYTFITLNYDNEKIIKDIVNKCYRKNPDEYKLKYHEFAICTIDNHTSQYSTKILDTLTFQFNNVDEIIHDTPTQFYHSISVLYISTSINTDIVDVIMTQLIPDRLKRDAYKKLCHGIFVQKPNSPFIFEDICAYGESNQLTSWIHSMHYTLACPGNSQIYLKYSTIKERNNQIKEFIKENKNNPPRFVEINNARNQSDINKCIEECNKIGINIYIIPNRSRESIYNRELCVQYMTQNYDTIKQHFGVIDDNYDKYRHMCNVEYIDDIFYRTSILHTNFIKWCLT